MAHVKDAGSECFEGGIKNLSFYKTLHMLTHLFKLIWNKKKQNFLLMMEMFVSFIIMFAVFTLLVYYYQNNNRPSGFAHENVWLVNYQQPQEIKGNDSLAAFHQTVYQLLKTMPMIQEVSFAGSNVPFSMNTHNNDMSYNNIHQMADIYITQDSYKDVLGLSMKEGRWFSKEDNAAKEKPAIINTSLKEKFFPHENALGKLIDFEGSKMKVVGVVNDFKDKSDYQGPSNSFFARADSNYQNWLGAILIKVSADADAAFESRLYKSLSNTIRNSTIEIEHLEKKRISKNNVILVPMIILLIVAGFLIINVALGLFGVLWYNINKRRSEIGLRRAVGASGNSISKQLVGEALVLSTISLLIGSFFAVQFPLLNIFDLATSTYLLAWVLALAFIYVLVIICALYPGRQAAAIYPAVALHEE